ncbi:MAG: PASTA domain-containing protein [bacterium]|nr:PASTA domain-containing protein [bacterium]
MKRVLKLLKYLIYLMIFGGLMFIGLLFGFKIFLTKPVVTVPDIEGKHKAEALKALRKADLKYEIIYQNNETISKDSVIVIKPSAGAKVKKGREIEVHVSKGFGNIKVPDLSSLDLINADMLLNEMGLSLGTVDEIRTNYVGKGIIVSQTPDPGEEVEKDSRINVIVNQGPEDKRIFVNNFVGHRIETLEDFENKLSLVIVNEFDTETYGMITNQSIPLGSLVELGTPIEFEYNPEITSPFNTQAVSITNTEEQERPRDYKYITYIVPPGFVVRKLRVILAFAGGKEDIFEGEVSPGSRFEKIIHFSGTGIVYFYLDGKLQDYRKL